MTKKVLNSMRFHGILEFERHFTVHTILNTYWGLSNELSYNYRDICRLFRLMRLIVRSTVGIPWWWGRGC